MIKKNPSKNGNSEPEPDEESEIVGRPPSLFWTSTKETLKKGSMNPSDPFYWGAAQLSYLKAVNWRAKSNCNAQRIEISSSKG